MSYKEKRPIPITEGGTNTTTLAVDGTLYFDGASVIGTSTGTSGWVLTSNGAGFAPTYQTVSASGALSTLTGNTGGAISPSSGNINLVTAHANVIFAGSGSTLTVDFDNALHNLILGPTINTVPSGGSNVFVGSFSGGNLTSGSENVCVGAQSGDCQSASFNVSIGFQALQSNQTINSNTAVGFQAIQGLFIGSGQNTGIGGTTLFNLTSGNNNVAIGYSAGSAYTGGDSNNIVITNVGVAAESGAIRIGTSGTQTTAFIAGVSGVAVANTNMVTINTATGQFGSQAVPTGGITTLAAGTGSATGSTVTITGSDGVTTVASASTMTIELHGVGIENLFLGETTGNRTLSGDYNTAVGSNTMNRLTSGTQNTACGIENQLGITVGQFNTSIGSTALRNLGTGGTDNSYNTALGASALFQLGEFGNGGSNNIGVGYQAGFSWETTESSNIAIGNTGTTGESNIIRIGTFGTGAGQQNQTFLTGTVNKPNNPAFSAYVSTNQANVTGDGTSYTVVCDTSIYDQNSNYSISTGEFTAPVSGIYFFQGVVALSGLGIAFTTGYIGFQTTSSFFTSFYLNPGTTFAAGGFLYLNGSCFAHMNAGDTCMLQVVVAGSTKTITVDGGPLSGPASYFSGQLVC
jgi:hypothetical protein